MLSGCRVLDFTQYLAAHGDPPDGGDGCGHHQGGLAPMGDPARLLPMVKSGRSGYFVQQNRGKEKVCASISIRESARNPARLVTKVISWSRTTALES